MYSEIVDAYLQTESSDNIVLLGDKVELDCITNTSRPPDWYLTRHGSNIREFINGNGQAYSNISNAYRIVSKDFGHVTLLIDSVLPTLAGRYECQDREDKYKLSAEVTIVGKDNFCNIIKTIHYFSWY